MNPHIQAAQYIENEAFKGRSVSDILGEMRQAGWQEMDIQVAVAYLNQQHDVLKQIDMDPLHRNVDRRPNVKAILIAALAAFIFVVIIFFTFIRSTVAYTSFVDPNFTMRLPQDWSNDDAYKPGAGTILFHSSENSDVRNIEKAAFLTVYQELYRDSFGKQIIAGVANVRVLSDSSTIDEGVTYRYIEYEQNGTFQLPEKTRGAYVLATKGELVISASLATKEAHWGRHADDARKILLSIAPSCSIRQLDAEYDEDDTIMLCQYEI